MPLKIFKNKIIINVNKQLQTILGFFKIIFFTFAGAAFFPPRPFLVLVMGFSGEAMAAGAALEAARAALPRCALTGLTGTSDSLMGSPRRNFVFIGFSFNEDFAA